MKNYLLIIVLCICIISCIIPNNSDNIKGKKILITAPSNYNNRLSNLINESGAKAIKMPTIKISLNLENPQLNILFKNLTKYNYICLPSRNAIKVFFTKAKSLNIDNKTLSKPIYSAIGKDIEYLKTFNIKNILKCRKSSPLGIINSLKDDKQIKNKRIVVLCPQVIGLNEPNVIPDFLRDLKNIGLQVKRIDAYTTKMNDYSDFTKELKTITTGEINLIAFTSSAEIEALIKIVGSKEKLINTKIACFGPYTASNAQRLGLTPCFISKDYSSFEGYIQSIKKYFTKGK